MHYITKALQQAIHEQGGAAAAARSWVVSREAVMRWKRGAYLPTLQAFVRIMAASSSVQRTALFDALVSDAVGAVEANDLVPIDPAGAVPYAAVTPAAKSAHALRLRVANLEAALERAEAEAADARREHRAARVGERTAVAVFIRREAERLKALSLANAIAVAALADAIEAGVHRPGGDP
jgi:hypothetical protein